MKAPKNCPQWLELLFEFFDQKNRGPKLSQHFKKIKENWPEFHEKFRGEPKEKKEPDGVKNMAKATKQISEQVSSKPENMEQISNAMCQQMASLPDNLKDQIIRTLTSSPSSSNGGGETCRKRKRENTVDEPEKIEEIKTVYTSLCTDIEKFVDNTEMQTQLIDAASVLYQNALQPFSRNEESSFEITPQ